MNKIAILGIHTGIGKTIASAVIAEALEADYWKPVQAGIEERDITIVGHLLTHGHSRVHNEAVLLSQPLSPHAAAAIDNVSIDYTQFVWPETGKMLIVETAGGVLSPINTHYTMADFVAHYNLPSLLVVQHYLGSINHTLLSIEVLQKRNINLMGLVINGAKNEASEVFINEYTGVPVVVRIPRFDLLDNPNIVASATQVTSSLQQIIASAGKY